MSLPSIEALTESLDHPSNGIGMRMRAAYYLRQAYETNAHNDTLQQEIIYTLGDNLLKESHGSLMRHEIAYVMGQLRDDAGFPFLQQVLSNEEDCIMVRHECAEALGAIGNLASLVVLEKFSHDVHPEVSETCRIAVDYVQWTQSQEKGTNVEDQNNVNQLPPVMACACMLSPYKSVDPAPALRNITQAATKEVIELGSLLREQSHSLFERYRAMFTLRNINTAQSAMELGNTLVTDQSSALLRHEIAYVLGQMQNSASIPMLIQSLANTEEHIMVRHESAEALGAMCDLGGASWEECKNVLEEFQSDKVLAVAESCLVALDAADYWETFSSSNQDTEPPEENKSDHVPVTFAAQKALSVGQNSPV